MSHLINLAGALMFSAVIMAGACFGAIIDYLLNQVNWNLVIVIGISAVVILALAKTEKE
ncbi:hypothetical protein [Dyadobacter diqingensis]|uniref:hypothetical protein n=1 Tax=Dyadobacter diqingensis TaxID=2938121 RepID=UPI0020C51123|nr:hypothetical protein [Dyadobacter diqingensis]